MGQRFIIHWLVLCFPILHRTILVGSLRGGAFAFAPPQRLSRNPIRFPTTLSDSADPVASMKALDAIVPRAEITKLLQNQSDQPATQQLFLHATLYTLAALSGRLSILAFVSSFFFHGLHETVHGTAFSTKWKNRVASHLFGGLTLRPARHYFYYHWQHHKYTGHPTLDSELQPESFLDVDITTPWLYLWNLSGIFFWIDALASMIRHASGHCPEIYLKDKKQARIEVVREARCYLLVYLILALVGSLYSNVATFLWNYWLLPAFLGQPFLRFYLLCEHRGRKASNLIYENTRTMSSTHPLYCRLAWNMPFHMEHHAWPSVPFYRLREAHALLKDPELLRAGELDPSLSGKGYIGFNWIFFKKLFQSSRTS